MKNEFDKNLVVNQEKSKENIETKNLKIKNNIIVVGVAGAVVLTSLFGYLLGSKTNEGSSSSNINNSISSSIPSELTSSSKAESDTIAAEEESSSEIISTAPKDLPSYTYPITVFDDDINLILTDQEMEGVVWLRNSNIVVGLDQNDEYYIYFEEFHPFTEEFNNKDLTSAIFEPEELKYAIKLDAKTFIMSKKVVIDYGTVTTERDSSLNLHIWQTTTEHFTTGVINAYKELVGDFYPELASSDNKVFLK